jgi:hypothetical protein
MTTLYFYQQTTIFKFKKVLNVPIAYRCNDQIKWTNITANTILYNADSGVLHQ